MNNRKTIYLSQQNLARVTAKAWLYNDFRVAIETNPIPVIKKHFVYVNPPIFDDFDLLGIISDRPDGITDEELQKVIAGGIIALPDRYMPPQNDQNGWGYPTDVREDGTKIYLTQVEWSRITALAWLDPEFKEDLLTDPGTAIRKRSEFASFVFERPLWVPPPPPSEHISRETIEEIASGYREAMIIPFFTYSDG